MDVQPYYNKNPNVPKFKTIDNTADWSNFIFKLYKLFNACRSKASSNQGWGWKASCWSKQWVGVFHQGWILECTLPLEIHNHAPEDVTLAIKYYQGGAVRCELFPEEQYGCLNGKLLVCIELTKNAWSMEILCFLPFPFTNLQCLKIQNSQQSLEIHQWCHHPLCQQICHCGQWTGDKLQLSIVSNEWSRVVNFVGIVFCNSNKNTHESWCDDDDNLYSSLISDTMTHCRFINLRSNVKLNNNNKEIKHGEDGHDPCTKYWFILVFIMYNMNLLVKIGSCNLTMDGTMWSNMPFGANSHFWVQGKSGVTKGGKNVIVLDSKQCYTHAWYPCHGLKPKMYKKPFTQQGPHEVKTLLNLLNPLIVGYHPGGWDNCLQIFSEPPNLTFDYASFRNKRLPSPLYLSTWFLNNLKLHFHSFYMDKGTSNLLLVDNMAPIGFAGIGIQKERWGSARLPVLQIIKTDQCSVCWNVMENCWIRRSSIGSHQQRLKWREIITIIQS